MIRRFLLTAALIVVGSVAVAPKTIAQSVDVPFTGSVGGVCNVSQVTPGVLIGGPTPGIPTSLDSQGGSNGKVSVSCNQTATVSVSLPQKISGPDLIPVGGGAWVNLSSGSGASLSSSVYAYFDGTNASGQIPPATGMNLEVSLYVNRGIALIPGVYEYVTTVSITPF